MKRFFYKLLISSLFCFDGFCHIFGSETDVVCYTTDNSLSSNIITEIFQDSVGYIWLKTEVGYDRFDGYEFRHYEEPAWCDSIVSVPISDAEKAEKEEKIGGIILARYKDRDGNMWFGTYGSGMACVMSNALGENVEKQASRHVVDIGNQCNRNIVELTVSRLEYGRMGDVVYEYRLDEAEEWSMPQQSHRIVLQGLSAGNHIIDIRSRRGDEYEWSEVTQYAFSVPLPWALSSIWAWVVYVLVIVAVLMVNRMMKTRAVVLETKIKDREQQISGRDEQIKLLEGQIDEKDSVIASLKTIAGTATKLTTAPTAESSKAMQTAAIDAIIIAEIANTDFCVNDFAAKMHMTPAQLFRHVKEVTGYAPIEYLKIYRMKVAAEMLRTSEKSVSEIARHTGFSDITYFSRAFKQQFGVSPRQYRVQ